jgi:Tfp pilus assembly PilM family ATPase
MEVILVAAKKDVIDTYMSWLVDAGLRPAIIDVDRVRPGQFLHQELSGHNPGHPSPWWTIGANKMNINVLKQGGSLFTQGSGQGRRAHHRGNPGTSSTWIFQTAEGHQAGRESRRPIRRRSATIVSRAVENWVSEARRTVGPPFRHVSQRKTQGNLPQRRIEPQSAGWTPISRQEMGVPVKMMNPFLHIGVDSKKFLTRPYLEYIRPAKRPSAWGLALRRGK